MCVCVCAGFQKDIHICGECVCVAYDAGLLLQPLHSCNGNMHAARCTMLRAFSEFHEIAPTQPPPPLGHTLTHHHTAAISLAHIYFGPFDDTACFAELISFMTPHDPCPHTLATPAHSRSLSHSQPAAITPSHTLLFCPRATLLCIVGPARLQFNF